MHSCIKMQPLLGINQICNFWTPYIRWKVISCVRATFPRYRYNKLMRLGPKVMFLSSIIIKFRCYCHLSNSCEDWSLGISRKPFLWPKERRYQNRTNDHRITNILFKVKVVNKKIFKSFKQWKLVQSTTNITTTTTTIPEVSVGFEPGIWRKSSWEHHSKWALQWLI